MWAPTVKDIQQAVKHPNKLLTIKENATVAKAAKKMRDHHIGCLVVFDTDGKFTGVLTERDILAKVTTKSIAPNNSLVSQVMTPTPISCTMDTTIENLEQLMAEHNIRHLPIVENDTPVGMISSRDIIAYRLCSNKQMKASAEQLALLSTELKSLNLREVISLAINEVPNSFQADRAVLCFPQKASTDLVIHRNGCPISRRDLLEPAKMRQLAENRHVGCADVYDQCKKAASKPPRLTIPLNLYDESENTGGNVCRVGFLCMCCFKPSAVDSQKLLLYKASLLQEILSVNLSNAKLYYDYQRARHDSEIDPLTGVGTRRVLDKVLTVELTRAIRYNNPFSIAIVDLDNFKEINDTAGHAAGDSTLQQLAEMMIRNIRTTDTIITRYGGDEFVLLMPETTLDCAKMLMERLRHQVKNISIPNIPAVTISCGLAEWNPTDSLSDDAETVLKRADDALYKAKHAGRNRIVASQAAAASE
ncbi:MAG: diguanylate cyclase [Planctomycetota bacterium]|jgi:diguanylate cyclase (GGDEF)-like protein